ncbi:MAG: nucleotidyltransferase domain-containing protein [Candidatus Caldarchaeum sp.]|nr:nucleotidyltransferase domain-containing protein [Candidatus Caldarchaeum sp.]
MKKQALEKVFRFVGGLEEAGYLVRCVVLFGSYARGDFTEGSDVDVCVVVDDLAKDEAGRPAISPAHHIHGIQVIAYCPSQFLNALRSLNPVALDTVHDGVVLRDDGFMAEAKTVYEKLKADYGLVRWKNGWRWRTTTSQR